LGGYAIGMWLMYARTEIIVAGSLVGRLLPPTPRRCSDGVAGQIFGVVGSVGPARDLDLRPSLPAARAGGAGARACWRWSSAGWRSAAA
jgi:hypothetical protein